MDPPILFFFFGILAVLVKSNLEIPQALSKFFSLYMLMAIGIKGGRPQRHRHQSRDGASPACWSFHVDDGATVQILYTSRPAERL